MPLRKEEEMMQKDDLDRALKVWGHIKVPVSKKSVKLWGKIEPEFVINLYKMLNKGLVSSEHIPLKRRNKNRTHA